jgi:hypothetical protein
VYTFGSFVVIVALIDTVNTAGSSIYCECQVTMFWENEMKLDETLDGFAVIVIA